MSNFAAVSPNFLGFLVTPRYAIENHTKDNRRKGIKTTQGRRSSERQKRRREDELTTKYCLSDYKSCFAPKKMGSRTPKDTPNQSRKQNGAEDLTKASRPAGGFKTEMNKEKERGKGDREIVRER